MGKRNKRHKRNVANVAENNATNKDKNLSIQTFDNLAEEGKNLQKLKCIWGNFILDNNLVLFASERWVGKSLLMLQLAYSISMELPEYCGEPLEKHGNTLYINLELGENILRRRLTKLKESLPKDKLQRYNAYSITPINSGGLNSILNGIKLKLNEIKPVLVIIDNLRTAFSNTDNEKNKDMTKVIKELYNLKDHFGFSLVIVHHTKKGSSNKISESDLQSGAGAISDLVDADFFLRKSKVNQNQRILKRVKSRECEDQIGAKLLEFNSNTLWFELKEESIDESLHIFDENKFRNKTQKKNKAKELRDAGKSMQKIGDVLDVNKATISRWLSVANSNETNATNAT